MKRLIETLASPTQEMRRYAESFYRIESCPDKEWIPVQTMPEIEEAEEYFQECVGCGGTLRLVIVVRHTTDHIQILAQEDCKSKQAHKAPETATGGK